MSVYIEVLTEGASDVPVVEQLMKHHFGLTENEHYRIHPHAGKGKLPANLSAQPARNLRGLLDQLPAKLRGFGKWLPHDALVLVLIDLDSGDCKQFLAELLDMYNRLEVKPNRVLFRIAIEETESWFLADTKALKAGYPKAKISEVTAIEPDAVIGAWERLAHALSIDPNFVTGVDKFQWAKAIAPHLDFIQPRSPSLLKLVEGTQRYLNEVAA